MKAAVLHTVNQPLSIEEVAVAKPQRREVLVRTAATGLCHSDLHFIEGLYPAPLPAVPGHEAAGIVEAVGEDVTYLKPGDHVITCLSVFCGHCEYCLGGRHSLCSTTEVTMPHGLAKRLPLKGQPLDQLLNLSSSSTPPPAPEHTLVTIP